MHFHVFPHPTHRAGRQSALCLRCWRQPRNINRAQARARVQVALRWIVRGTHRFRWSHKHGPTVIAAGDQQSRRDIAAVLAPEEVDVSLENRPQAGTGLEPAIIEHEGRARDPVCTDDALASGNRQQHARSASFRRRYRDDPLSTEVLAKKSFFYRARRSYCEGASQRVRSFGESRIDGRDVQDCNQPPIDPEHRRAGAAQVDVSGPEMLASVNGDRPLFGDAGADAVCALHFLGPHPAEPGSPILELACQRIFTTMRDCDARAITEQDGVSSLTNHLVQFIHLLLGSEDELIQRFAKMFQLPRREDAWRLAVEWIEAVFF